MPQARTGRTGRQGNGWLDTATESVETLIAGKKTKKQLAREVAEGWHGRAATKEFTVVDVDKFPSNVAQMGWLVELAVVVADSDSAEIVPVVFSESDYVDTEDKTIPLVCSTPDRKQILFVGGDQTIDVEELLEELDYTDEEIDELTNRHKVVVGEVYSITYFADKHHLTGPKSQKKGVPYEHKFGERGGKRPILVYNTESRKVELVGGSYEIRDEGIYN